MVRPPCLRLGSANSEQPSLLPTGIGRAGRLPQTRTYGLADPIRFERTPLPSEPASQLTGPTGKPGNAFPLWFRFSAAGVPPASPAQEAPWPRNGEGHLTR